MRGMDTCRPPRESSPYHDVYVITARSADRPTEKGKSRIMRNCANVSPAIMGSFSGPGPCS